MSTKEKPNSEEISNEHQRRYDGKMKDYDATVGDLKKKKMPPRLWKDPDSDSPSSVQSSSLRSNSQILALPLKNCGGMGGLKYWIT